MTRAAVARRDQFIRCRTPVAVSQRPVEDLQRIEFAWDPRPASFDRDQLSPVLGRRRANRKVLQMPGEVNRIAAGPIEINIEPPGEVVRVSFSKIRRELISRRACPSQYG